MLFSPFESNLLGLRIGRYGGTELDIPGIKKAMKEEALDICRLKFPANLTNINEQLMALELPVFYGGAVLNYEMHFFDLTIGPYLNSNIEFKEVFAIDAELLRNLIEKAFVNDPIGFYKIPGVQKYFTKEAEAACMAAWHVNLIESPDHLMMVSKIGEDYNGFIAIYKSGENSVITPIAGVLPSDRGKDVFHDLRTFRHQYCLEHKIPIGFAGARLDNFYSQKLFIGDGMKPLNADLVYFVTRKNL